MAVVTVQASKSYDVLISSGLIEEAGKLVRGVCSGGKALIVSDENVFSLYGKALSRSLEMAGFHVFSFVFPSGEASKTLSTYACILDRLCEVNASRQDVTVALGGGVAGDVAGFAAATYRRGMGFVQVPTSLLAAVDSSVGGKTAVNREGGKNQAGCFYQPDLVIADTDTLSTLPEEEYRNGCAEIIKYGVLGSRALFESILEKPVREDYARVIEQCVQIKRGLVEQDERDTGKRMLLNLGHTLGHAAEKISGYTIPHGRAVAMGMAAAARAACAHSVCGQDVCKRIEEVLALYGLPAAFPFTAEETASACLSDKKGDGFRVKMILPEKIGACRITEIPADGLISWLKAGGL